MIASTMHAHRALLCVTAFLACSTLAACRGDDRNAEPTGAIGALGPAPSPVPAPGPAPLYVATPVPFNLTQGRTFDTLGWDSWPSAPTPSTTGFRWNATIGRYEVLAKGYAGWSRLEAKPDRFGYTPFEYDVFGGAETKLPFYMLVFAPPDRGPADLYVGNARIFEGVRAHSYFAFGLATEPGDVPVTGTMTCTFGEDEIGWGELVVDLGARTMSGWVHPFWGDARYQLTHTSFPAGGTTFTATFGTGGVLEGRFFGPRAANLAVRAKGGVTGVMTGTREG